MPGEDKPMLNGHASGAEDDEGVPDRAHLLAQLPEAVRNRVAALRKLQLESLGVEAEFYKAIHKLECDFQSKFDAIHEKRRMIVIGAVEPTAEEKAFPLFDPSEKDISAEFEKLCVSESATASHKEYEGKKGVPMFWLHVLQNIELTSDLIEAQDVDVLEHLQDITCHLQQEPMAYTLKFHFSLNEHFENTVLTKTYYLKCAVDKDDMADFDGPEIVKSEGCTINWKPGKDTTKSGTGEEMDSFFNFFSPPDAQEGVEGEARDMALDVKLHLDFEVGHNLRETIVPHALLHYTFEANDDDDDFDDLDDEDEEDEGDDA